MIKEVDLRIYSVVVIIVAFLLGFTKEWVS